MKTIPGRPRVLLCDDHHLLLEGMRVMLSNRDDIAGLAHNGAELMLLLGRTDADCLLLDLAMPGRSGIELLPDIRRMRPNLRVLIVTMHMDRILADAAMHAGANGFIPKDSGVDELSEAIDEVLSGKSWMSPRVPAQSSTVVAGRAPLAELTPRQIEIVQLLGQGKSSGEIAELLGVSDHTITFHRDRIRGVLGANEWGAMMAQR